MFICKIKAYLSAFSCSSSMSLDFPLKERLSKRDKPLDGKYNKWSWSWLSSIRMHAWLQQTIRCHYVLQRRTERKLTHTHTHRVTLKINKLNGIKRKRKKERNKTKELDLFLRHLNEWLRSSDWSYIQICCVLFIHNVWMQCACHLFSDDWLSLKAFGVTFDIKLYP